METLTHWFTAETTCGGPCTFQVLNKHNIPLCFSWFYRPLPSFSFHLSLFSLWFTLSLASFWKCHLFWSRSQSPTVTPTPKVGQAADAGGRHLAFSRTVTQLGSGENKVWEGKDGQSTQAAQPTCHHTLPQAPEASCLHGGVAVWYQWYLGPGRLSDPGLPGLANVLLTQAPARPILMKFLGPRTPTWPLQETWTLVRSGGQSICMAILDPSLSFGPLKLPSASSPWKPLPRLLPSSGALAPGPHKADQ